MEFMYPCTLVIEQLSQNEVKFSVNAGDSDKNCSFTLLNESV